MLDSPLTEIRVVIHLKKNGKKTFYFGHTFTLIVPFQILFAFVRNVTSEIYIIQRECNDTLKINGRGDISLSRLNNGPRLIPNLDHFSSR